MVIALPVIGYSDEPGAAQVQNDTAITQKIVGTWKVDETTPNGIKALGFVSIKKDGTFTSKGSLTQGDNRIDLDFAGRWQVDGGILTETVTASSHTNLPPIGYVSHDKILKVDDQHLVYQTDKGKVVDRKRVE